MSEPGSLFSSVEDCHIEYTPRPWDTEAFGCKSAEILKVQLSSKRECNALALENVFKHSGAQFLYGRFSANDRKIKEFLCSHGFSIYETALDLSLPRLQDQSIPSFLVKRNIQVRIAEKKDMAEILEKGSQMFSYSRFHESPLVSVENANRRISIWLNHLIDTHESCLVYSQEERVVAFIFYSVDGQRPDTVRLVLGGTLPGYELYSPYFWASFVQYFKNQGVRKLLTRISAANEGVANLYFKLGFQLVRTLFDYQYVSPVAKQ